MWIHIKVCETLEDEICLRLYNKRSDPVFLAQAVQDWVLKYTLFEVKYIMLGTGTCRQKTGSPIHNRTVSPNCLYSF